MAIKIYGSPFPLECEGTVWHKIIGDGPGGPPPFPLRVCDRVIQPDERLHLPLVGSGPQHPPRIALLPVDVQDRQLCRQRRAGLPRGECGDDPAGWQVRKGVLAASRSAQNSGGPPEDADTAARRNPGSRHRPQPKGSGWCPPNRTRKRPRSQRSGGAYLALARSRR